MTASTDDDHSPPAGAQAHPVPLGAPVPQTDLAAFILGARVGSRSVFFVVMVLTYIGFGALAHDYGFSAGWAVASTVLQWAGPAQVILVTGLGSGLLVETAVAVALSSVRFVPIVVTLVPMFRRPTTRLRQLLVPVHFMAISVWVESMRHAPGLPRERRIAFSNGLGSLLMAVGVVSTVAGFALQSALPALFGAAAMFITPLSFLISTARNARLLLDKAALGLGMALAPVLAMAEVPFDLLWTGILAGSAAYGWHRLARARKSRATDSQP